MRYFTHKISTIFLLLSLPSVYCLSQTTLRGEIRDNKGVPVSDITVVVSSRADSLHTIAYTFSNEKGYYSLSFNTSESEVRISAYGFNIRKVKRIVANRSATVNFSVTPEVINLHEVTVKAGKLWQIGDTLNYSVGAFLGKNDISIGDVIKKMPGLSVTSSGEVFYQGKPISHFYIDGLDVLQGRYGIATKNLTPKVVSVVQVLENHQPIKALKKINIPEQAAINLKLKDSAKGVFNIEAMLGGGADGHLLWRNELVGTYFTKKKQYFATYKNANDGTDIGSELQSYNGDEQARAGQYTAVKRPSTPSIDKSQYYFNHSNAASFNTVWKSTGGNKVNVGLVYFNDHESRNSLAETTYIIPSGSNTVISEALHDGSNTDRVEGNFSYEINREKLFFKENISLKSSWYRDKGLVDTGRSIDQTLVMNNFRFYDGMHWIVKKNDYQGVDISSKLTYEEKPQTLSVYPCLYNTLFGSDDHSYEGIHQKVTSRTFAMDNSASLLTALSRGNLRLSPRAILNVAYDGLNSRLAPLPASNGDVDNKLRNDTHLYYLKSGLSADISYEWPGVQINCFVPCTFNINGLKQKVQSLSSTRCDFNMEFYSNISWSICNNLSAVWHYSITRNYPGIETLYGGYIMSNYRCLSAYTADLYRGKWQFADMQCQYKNSLNMLFSSFTVSYSRSDPKVLYGENLTGIFSNITTKETDRYSENYSAKAYISKGFCWKGLTFSFTGTWNKSHSLILRQDEVVKFLSENYSVEGNTKIDLFKFFTLNYNGAWYLGRGKQENGEEFPTMRTFTNNVSVSLQLPFGLYWDASLNNYYNNQALGNKSFTLSGTSLSLDTKAVRYSLSCQNIFNVKNYTYSYIGDMTRFYSQYHIRPRAVMFTARFKLK